MSVRKLVLAAPIALVIAACGTASPQAPFPQAKRLDSATSGIAMACGESYQVSAFRGDHRYELARLDATATTAAVKLAGVLRRNPAWVYQGETIGEIALNGVSLLRACGLRRAADSLAAASAGH